MSPFALASVFAGVVNLTLAIFVFTRKPATRSKQIFLLCGCSIAVWNFSAFAMFRAQSVETALWWSRILHLGVIYLPALFFDLSIAITSRSIGRWRFLPYLFFTLVAAADLTPLFVQDARRLSYGWYGLAGPLYWIFTATMPIGGITAVAIMFHRRRQAVGAERRQLAALICGCAVLMVVGANDLLPVWGFERYPETDVTIYPWGTLAAAVFGVLVAYAILQDQMLDVRITLSRRVATMVRLLFLLSIAFVFLFAIELTSKTHSPLHVFGTAMLAMATAALVAGFVFPKLFGTTSERLERRILGDTFEYQEQLRALIGNLETLREHNEVVAHVNDMLGHRMKLRTFAIVLLNPQTRQTRTLRLEGLAETREADWSYHGSVFRLMRQANRRYVPLSPVFGSTSNNTQLSEAMRGMLEFLFPIQTDTEPFGILAVGRKADGSSISAIDRELLESLAAKIATVAERIHLADQAALAARLEHLAMMSRGLAHDLNNLITPISSFLVHVDGKFPSGTAQAEVHQHAKRSVKVMQEYIRDAMFFGKRLAPKMQPLSLAKMFATVREIVAQRAAQRGVAVVFESDVDYQCNADPLLLQRLLTNLVNNAIDASDAGETVRLDASQTPCRRLRVRVIDSGCGISEENLNRIFEPYFTTKQFGDDIRGFGLGLSICRKIVDLHDGDITVESKLNAGTTVTVDFPASITVSSAAPAAEASSAVQAAS